MFYSRSKNSKTLVFEIVAELLWLLVYSLGFPIGIWVPFTAVIILIIRLC